MGDRLGEMSTQSGIVATLYDLGAWDKLIAVANEILPQIDALGHRYNMAYIRHLQGLAFYSLGDFANARQQLLDAKKDLQALNISTILVDSSLGLIAEGEGQDEEALRFYQKALDDTGQAEEKNTLKLDIGILLWKLERAKDAIPYLESVYAARQGINEDLAVLKCGAYFGSALLTLGEQTRAQELAENNWAIFQKGIPLGEQPQGWLWGFYQLLIALNKKESALEVLRASYAELQRQASAIGDAEMRRSFFARVPLNAEIIKAYDALNNTARVLTVSLARKDVPLGRSLRDDEYVSVQWTIHAPEDESITDKVERRQYRLKRLLAEASAQSAAPTDDDLAGALGVSRRTVLRDMQELAQNLSAPPTRKRK